MEPVMWLVESTFIYGLHINVLVEVLEVVLLAVPTAGLLKVLLMVPGCVIQHTEITVVLMY